MLPCFEVKGAEAWELPKKQARPCGLVGREAEPIVRHVDPCAKGMPSPGEMLTSCETGP